MTTPPRLAIVAPTVADGNPSSPSTAVVGPAPAALPTLFPADGPVARAQTQRVSIEHRKAMLVLASTYVFEYWRETYGKPRAKLDANRLRVILRAVNACEGHLSDLLYAFDGAKRDDWIMGRALGSTSKYDTPETILRDRASVERHADRISGWGRDESHPAIASLPPALTEAASWT